MIPSRSTGRRQRHSPATLKHIAANKAAATLFDTSNNLNFFLQQDSTRSRIHTNCIISSLYLPVTSDSSSTKYFSDVDDSEDSSRISIAKNLKRDLCSEVAHRVFHLRKFVQSKLCPETQPILLRHTIARAVETQNIPALRLAITKNTEVLDFRAQDYYLNRSFVPHNVCKVCLPLKSHTHTLHTPQDSLSTGSSNTSLAVLSYVGENSTGTFIYVGSPVIPKYFPPCEHDWSSRDKYGKTVSVPEACELFSVTKMSQCSENLKEFYINAHRKQNDLESFKEILPIILDTLMQFKFLQTLVLRGIADDNMLQIVGETCAGLKHFDMSGSKFVTDDGIKRLFFKDLTRNAALYMIGSWVAKNLDILHPLADTVEHFDCSWTSVTNVSRKMISMLPGCYMFRRFFAKTEDDAYGHHLFIRKPPDLVKKIQPKLGKDWSIQFEAQLQSYTGPKGLKGLSKFMEIHPWNNCVLSVFVQDEEYLTEKFLDDNPTCSAFVTPNELERRIYGGFTFFCGNVTELYSIFPLNINLVGECFPKLKMLRGNITDVWKMKCSLLPELTDFEIFSSPVTAVSLFEFSPNIRTAKIRIVKEAICDDHLLKSIPISMCRRTLEELWIAPGVYKKFPVRTESRFGNISDISASKSSVVGVSSMSSFFGLELENKDVKVYLENLVHLSLDCIKSLVRECKRLRRLGDICWWDRVDEKELFRFCDELKAENTVMALIWENKLFPEHQQS